MRQCGVSLAPSQPQHRILTSKTWSRPSAHIQTPDPAPTRCLARTGNGLPKEGVGRRSGGCEHGANVSVPHHPGAARAWPSRRGKPITAWLLPPSPVPLQLRQLPERERTSKYGTAGPKARSKAVLGPPALSPAPRMALPIPDPLAEPIAVLGTTVTKVEPLTKDESRVVWLEAGDVPQNRGHGDMV